jgi:hypothetical protein
VSSRSRIAELPIDQQFLDTVITLNRAAGVSWIAGATSMLGLAPGERLRRLGYVPGPGEPTLAEREQRAKANLSQHAAAAAIPTSIDWRNIGGRIIDGLLA